MIEHITVKYQDKQRRRVVSNFGHPFVQEAIDNPPKSVNISAAQYKHVPVRKKIFMHVREFVNDMGGSGMSFHVS